MPRSKNTIRPVSKHLSLPEDLVAKIELELFSELEGKVPFGAWNKFLTDLIQDRLIAQKRAAAFADSINALTTSGAPPEAVTRAALRELEARGCALGARQAATYLGVAL